MPDRLALHNACGRREESGRVDERVDGTVTGSGHAVDSTTADFLRIESGVAAPSTGTTLDDVRTYQALGQPPITSRTPFALG